PTPSTQSSMASQSNSSKAESRLSAPVNASGQSKFNGSDNGNDDNASDSDLPETMCRLFEQFADQHLEVKPYSSLSPAAAFNAYSDWCSSQQPPLKWSDVADEEMFDQLMESTGYTKKQKSGEPAAHWYNVTLHGTT